MKSIITVLGKDKVGIIAKICGFLAETNVNVLDISQTIVQGYFNMMMIVELEKSSQTYEQLHQSLTQIGDEFGLEIRVQREEIFDSMHRI